MAVRHAPRYLKPQASLPARKPRPGDSPAPGATAGGVPEARASPPNRPSTSPGPELRFILSTVRKVSTQPATVSEAQLVRSGRHTLPASRTDPGGTRRSSSGRLPARPPARSTKSSPPTLVTSRVTERRGRRAAAPLQTCPAGRRGFRRPCRRNSGLQLRPRLGPERRASSAGELL